MRGAFLLTIIAWCYAADSVAQESARHLLIEFDAATSSVVPRPPGQRLIPLPALTFPVRVEARCEAGMTVDSISVSIADTRKVLRPGEGQRIEDTLRVPATQLAPVAAANFCRQGEDENATSVLQIRDALSAQVSLRCRGESGDKISYKNVPLQLTLQCSAARGDQPPVASASSGPSGVDGSPM